MIFSDVLEEELLTQLPEDKFDEVQNMETIELLDNLGYITFDKNDPDDFVTEEETILGIRKFRSEYLIEKNIKLFQKKYELSGDLPEFDLTEDELNFLEDLSSLEGDFELHNHALQEIDGNPILTRVLNYRLSILAVVKVVEFNHFLEQTSEILDKLCGWCGLSKGDFEKVIMLLGDITELSESIVSQTNYPGSVYKQVVYFYNEVDLDQEKKFRRKGNSHLFEATLLALDPQNRKDFNQTKTGRPKKIKVKVDDPLNQIVIRLIQLRLYLYGTYDAKLDNDIGEMSFQALLDFLAYVEKTYEREMDVNLILAYLKRDYWVINSTYLLKMVMIPFDRFLDKIKNQEIEESMEEEKKKKAIKSIPYSTLSEGLFDEIQKLPEEEHEAAFSQINKIIDEQDKVNQKARQHKTKTRGFKRFLISVKEFFRKIGTAILDGIKMLFRLIKNGVQILIREIKKFYNLVKAGIAFLFSKRIVATKLSSTQSIVSDYDGDFDCVTKVTTDDESTILQHKSKNEYLSQAVEEASGFMGMVLFWAIKIASGPYGWIKLGIYLIKKLAEQLFNYQRFSFAV